MLTRLRSQNICGNGTGPPSQTLLINISDLGNGYVQCPTWGYPSEGSYYRDTSCVDAVAAIRTPVLALHAEDDPVCLDVAVPYHLIETNPYLVICATTIGGHLGWFEMGGGRWSNQMV